MPQPIDKDNMTRRTEEARNEGGLMVAGASLHPLEALLQNLPVFEAFDFFHGGGVDSSFLRVLSRLGYFVENSKGAGKRLVCQLVCSHFVGYIMGGRHEVEHPAFARVGG